MIDQLKKAVALCVGAIALVTDAFQGRRRRRRPAQRSLLRELATEKSATVLDLSSRAKVSEPAALAILVELAGQGLVQLSSDKGAEHVRIAAITDAGRQECARLRL
jgi:DNA-binding MarR family transcriptional regulator